MAQALALEVGEPARLAAPTAPPEAVAAEEAVPGPPLAVPEVLALPEKLSVPEGDTLPVGPWTQGEELCEGVGELLKVGLGVEQGLLEVEGLPAGVVEAVEVPPAPTALPMALALAPTAGEGVPPPAPAPSPEVPVGDAQFVGEVERVEVGVREAVLAGEALGVPLLAPEALGAEDTLEVGVADCVAVAARRGEAEAAGEGVPPTPPAAPTLALTVELREGEGVGVSVPLGVAEVLKVPQEVALGDTLPAPLLAVAPPAAGDAVAPERGSPEALSELEGEGVKLALTVPVGEPRAEALPVRVPLVVSLKVALARGVRVLLAPLAVPEALREREAVGEPVPEAPREALLVAVTLMDAVGVPVVDKLKVGLAQALAEALPVPGARGAREAEGLGMVGEGDPVVLSVPLCVAVVEPKGGEAEEAGEGEAGVEGVEPGEGLSREAVGWRLGVAVGEAVTVEEREGEADWEEEVQALGEAVRLPRVALALPVGESEGVKHAVEEAEAVKEAVEVGEEERQAEEE